MNWGFTRLNAQIFVSKLRVRQISDQRTRVCDVRRRRIWAEVHRQGNRSHIHAVI